MDGLPSNIMFDVFSRVPTTKCLAHSRCVSKLWCECIDDRYLVIIHDERVKEEPTPILYCSHFSCKRITRSLCFHDIKSKQITGTAVHTYVLEPKEGPFLEFLSNKPLSKSSYVQIEVRGSCNGLMCLSQDENNVVTSLVVVHSLRKECYELQPLPMRFDSSMLRESCGLGFDASTYTLKMVYVLFKECAPINSLDKLEYEHVVYESDFTGMRLQHRQSKPEYDVDSKNLLDRVSSSKRRSSDTDVLVSPCLIVLITGTVLKADNTNLASHLQRACLMLAQAGFLLHANT
ncbi:F-box domain containing protein [Tanacetum coccineum]